MSLEGLKGQTEPKTLPRRPRTLREVKRKQPKLHKCTCKTCWRKKNCWIKDGLEIPENEVHYCAEYLGIYDNDK